MKAILRSARITPKKLNLIADMIRGKNATEALNLLKFTPKKSAHMMGKLLKSAIANAENNFKQEKDTLYVKEIYVTKAPTLKRNVSVSRGRMHPILKRNAHATIFLAVKEAEKKTAAKKETSGKEVKAELSAETKPAKTAAKAKKAAPKKSNKTT